MPLFVAVLRKMEYLATWLSHVRKAGSHVTLRTHYMDHIERSILSSLIIYSWCYLFPVYFLSLVFVMFCALAQLAPLFMVPYASGLFVLYITYIQCVYILVLYAMH